MPKKPCSWEKNCKIRWVKRARVNGILPLTWPSPPAPPSGPIRSSASSAAAGWGLRYRERKLVTYTTIPGARQHSAANQQHVDRAAHVLSTEFGNYASPDVVREHMADPQNVLVSPDTGVALVLRAGEEDQRLWLMWVEEKARGQGIGSTLLKHVLEAYTADHLMKLDCPAEREDFYKRHGFHSLFTASEGAYVYMAGPAERAADVQHLLPPPPTTRGRSALSGSAIAASLDSRGPAQDRVEAA